MGTSVDSERQDALHKIGEVYLIVPLRVRGTETDVNADTQQKILDAVDAS